VEKRLVDSGFFGDLLHSGARRPLTDKDGLGRLENALFRIGVALDRFSASLFNHLVKSYS